MYFLYSYLNKFTLISIKLCVQNIFLSMVGWMILVILIYHITGGDKHLPLYMHIRVLISSYIFLIGYEHFQYFWRLPHNSPERNKMLFIRFMQVGKVFIE